MLLPPGKMAPSLLVFSQRSVPVLSCLLLIRTTCNMHNNNNNMYMYMYMYMCHARRLRQRHLPPRDRFHIPHAHTAMHSHRV